MNGAARFGRPLETALMLALGLAAIYAGLLPFGLPADRAPAPDLVLALVAAWVIRRPDGAPLWAVLALGLAADAFLSRPLGLGALGLLASAEVLRAYAPVLRSGSFFVEWAVVSATMAAVMAATHLALQLTFSDGPGLAALLRLAGVTALAYPVVVAALNLGLGMRAPRRARTPDRLGRIA